MPGTTRGGLRAARTNKIKHGDDFYARIGSLGGRAGTGHKFAHGKVDPASAGRKGGVISRRPKPIFVEQKEDFREGFDLTERQSFSQKFKNFLRTS